MLTRCSIAWAVRRWPSGRRYATTAEDDGTRRLKNQSSFALHYKGDGIVSPSLQCPSPIPLISQRNCFLSYKEPCRLLGRIITQLQWHYWLSLPCLNYLYRVSNLLLFIPKSHSWKFSASCWLVVIYYILGLINVAFLLGKIFTWNCHRNRAIGICGLKPQVTGTLCWFQDWVTPLGRFLCLL